MRRAWLLAVACADPGAGPNANTPSLIEVDSTNVTVTSIDESVSPTYKLAFPMGNGIPFPTSVDVGGMQGNLLAGSNANACNGQLQSGLGLGATDVMRATASGFGGESMGSGDVSFVLSGPAVAQIRVEWEASYSCNATTFNTSGVTTFTLFPTGRIVRSDESFAPTDTSFASTICCGVATSQVESYYQFAPNGIDRDITDTVITPATPAEQGCTIYNAGPDTTNVGVSWALLDGQPQGHAAGNSGWVFFLAPEAGPVPVATPQETSAIQLTKLSTCSEILPRLDDVHLVVDGNDLGTDNNGIFNDDNPHNNGGFDFVPKDGATLPGGFAIKIAIGDHAAITRSPPSPHSDFVIVQKLPDDPSRTLLWFRDDLGPNDKIHIEPQ